MATRVIDESRIETLNEAPPADGQYVMYWMQQSQRAERNHALEHAVRRANRLEKPLIAVFVVTKAYPDANLRHFRFMLEGLADTAERLARRRIGLIVRTGDPVSVVLDLSHDASEVVCDRGYLRHQRAWRTAVAKRSGCRVTQVESDLIVPVETASDRREYAARTFRPRIHARVTDYLIDLVATPLDQGWTDPNPSGHDPRDVEGLLAMLHIDRSVPPVRRFTGGTTEARRRLRRFLREALESYDGCGDQPHRDGVSFLSPYLHFGQISPLWVALEIGKADAPRRDKEAFLEQLIVRRELAANFVHYSPDDYDSYTGLPDWARSTLHDHTADTRSHEYTASQLAASETHDAYWNAAMTEMRETGYMHNRMRMYWGKKVVEWQGGPIAAYETLLQLNNRYFLDGRDPASYANVGWIFGLHDRPWKERPIFGKVRYMSAGGLERKTHPEAYVERVEGLSSLEGDNGRL